MQEYISKQKLFESLENIKAEFGNDNSSLVEQGEVLDLVFGFPPEDVIPVTHAHWDYPFNRDIAKCSVCDFCVQDKINNVAEMYKYCPNCGAKMDEMSNLERKDKTMNNNEANLLALIHNNPDLPVVCMVDGDVVQDDCGRWMASIGYCVVGEYTCYRERYYDDRESFMEDYYDNNQDILCERFGYDPRMLNPITEKRYKKEDIEDNYAAERRIDEYLEKVADKAFRKAIIVNIDTPDDYVEVADEWDVVAPRV